LGLALYDELLTYFLRCGQCLAVPFIGNFNQVELSRMERFWRLGNGQVMGATHWDPLDHGASNFEGAEERVTQDLVDSTWVVLHDQIDLDNSMGNGNGQATLIVATFR